eukprot:TRINITY_DN3420_c0_g1_i1.p1 TRINITY_DN3420_c0_g1~~TRINITY_DN3420_c0_g1_i1.p1  ORF type:complete len:341 (-),score=129.18 TRINITY_DN3420_c0_g1_i1:23-1045(-)
MSSPQPTYSVADKVLMGLRSALAGVGEALAVRRVWAALSASKRIRTCVMRCILLNGVLLCGSSLLFDYVVGPLLFAPRAALQRSVPSAAAAALLGFLYYALWLLPWYVLSYIFNASWYSTIARRYNELLTAQRARRRRRRAGGGGSNAAPDSDSGTLSASTSLSSSAVEAPAASAWESVLASLFDARRNAVEAVYSALLFAGLGAQCSLLALLPGIVGPLAQIVGLSWLYAFYSFDYRWRFGGFTVERRKAAFAADWAFFGGFGLPMTLLTQFAPFFVSYGVFALLFPGFIIAAIAAQRPKPDNGALGVLPLFALPSRIADAIVYILMRGGGSSGDKKAQ